MKSPWKINVLQPNDEKPVFDHFDLKSFTKYLVPKYGYLNEVEIQLPRFYNLFELNLICLEFL